MNDVESPEFDVGGNRHHNNSGGKLGIEKGKTLYSEGSKQFVGCPLSMSFTLIISIETVHPTNYMLVHENRGAEKEWREPGHTGGHSGKWISLANDGLEQLNRRGRGGDGGHLQPLFNEGSTRKSNKWRRIVEVWCSDRIHPTSIPLRDVQRWCWGKQQRQQHILKCRPINLPLILLPCSTTFHLSLFFLFLSRLCFCSVFFFGIICGVRWVGKKD